MKSKQKLEEDVRFWHDYINNWESKQQEPVPKKVLVLLKIAISKLEEYYKRERLIMLRNSNKQIMH